MTGTPTWSPGQVLTADDVNTWLVDTISIKTDAQHFTGTTLANVNGLVLPVAANASYLIECLAFYDGGPNGSSDMKAAWTGPAGSTLSFEYMAANAGSVFLAGTGYSGVDPGSNWVSLMTNGVGKLRTVLAKGSIVVGSTAGSLQLMAAQYTNYTTTDTIIHVGSYIKLTRAA